MQDIHLTNLFSFWRYDQLNKNTEFWNGTSWTEINNLSARRLAEIGLEQEAHGNYFAIGGSQLNCQQQKNLQQMLRYLQ